MSNKREFGYRLPKRTLSYKVLPPPVVEVVEKPVAQVTDTVSKMTYSVQEVSSQIQGNYLAWAKMVQPNINTLHEAIKVADSYYDELVELGVRGVDIMIVANYHSEYHSIITEEIFSGVNVTEIRGNKGL
jgi:hypothetical protein